MDTFSDYVKKGWPKPDVFNLLTLPVNGFYCKKDINDKDVSRADVIALFERIDLAYASKDKEKLESVLVEKEPLTGFSVGCFLNTNSVSSFSAYLELVNHFDIYEMWLAYVIMYSDYENLKIMNDVMVVTKNNFHWSSYVLLAARYGTYRTFCFTLFRLYQEEEIFRKLQYTNIDSVNKYRLDCNELTKACSENPHNTDNKFENVLEWIYFTEADYCINSNPLYNKPETFYARLKNVRNKEINDTKIRDGPSKARERYLLYSKTVKSYLRSIFSPKHKYTGYH